MLRFKSTAKMGIDELLSKFDSDTVLSAKRIIFEGVGNKDVYNITSPFVMNQREYIAGRVESRENDLDSKIVFFVKASEDEHNIKYVIDEKAKILGLQDPFFSIIDKNLIIGGVRFPLFGNSGFRTIFYKGESPSDLERFAQGPVGMKDIRIEQYKNQIYLFTRPQGSIGGLGRIGLMTLGSIEDLPKLKDEQYFSAPLLNLPIEGGAWIGANQVLLLENGNLGVLGHIACVSKMSEKNYYPMVFQLDPATKKISGLRIIVRRADLPEGISKNQDLKNVIFPGGLIRFGNGTAKLYAGVGDAEAYEITIKDPFLS